jgi:hypothetical protein
MATNTNRYFVTFEMIFEIFVVKDTRDTRIVRFMSPRYFVAFETPGLNGYPGGPFT